MNDKRIIVFIKGWDMYNAIIFKKDLETFKEEVKRQTGALRLHLQINEV